MVSPRVYPVTNHRSRAANHLPVRWYIIVERRGLKNGGWITHARWYGLKNMSSLDNSLSCILTTQFEKGHQSSSIIMDSCLIFLMGNTLAKIIKWEVVKKFEPTNCLESCFQWKVHMNLYQIPSNGRVETWINGCNIINQIIFFKPSNKFGLTVANFNTAS